MSNQLLHKFKSINDSRVRLKEILNSKGIPLHITDLPSLVESVNELQTPGYTVTEWNGIEQKYLDEPTDYYKYPLNLDEIYAEDTDAANYTNVAIYAYNDKAHEGNLIAGSITGFQYYKFSDSDTLVAGSSNNSPLHVWDESKDIEIGGEKYRYVICYSNSTLSIGYTVADFTPGAITVYKGAYSTFTIRNATSSPRYIEIKPAVTSITSIAGTSGENYFLQTFICQAGTTNFASNIFNGCYMLTFLKCTSTISAVGGIGWFIGLRNCWIHFKEIRNITSLNGNYINVLSSMTDCIIIIDHIYGCFLGCQYSKPLYSYSTYWYENYHNNRRCKLKIGTVHGNWYNNRTSNYDMELDIDTIQGAIIGQGNTSSDYGSAVNTFNAAGTLAGTYVGVKIGTIGGGVPANWANGKNVVGTITITGGTSSAPLTIGEAAFANNRNLTKFDGSAAFITTFGASVFANDYKLASLFTGDHTTSLGDNLINDCRSLKSLVLSPTQPALNQNVLAYSHLESITFGRLCTSIATSAMENLPIKYIELNEGLTTIGEAAFRNMPHLKHINLPSTLKNIPANCFYGCTELEEVYINSEDLNNIGANAFARCDKLSIIDLPPTTKIETQAFYMCHNITELMIHRYTAFVATSLQGSTNVRFAEGFNFDESEVSSLTMTNSNYTYDNILGMLYTLPQRSTTFSITLTPTYWDTCTSASNSFWYNLSRRYIKEVEDGIEFCDSSETGAMTVASYVSNKGYSIA